MTCQDCSAPCCQHVTIEIDPPETRRDWDNIRWFTAHQNVAVLYEKEEWLLEFQTPCNFHSAKGCQIYGKRPGICRDYSEKTCERDGTDHIRFTWPHEVELYLKEKGKEWW